MLLIEMVNNIRKNGSEQYKGFFRIRCIERVTTLHYTNFVFFIVLLIINNLKVIKIKCKKRTLSIRASQVGSKI